MKFSPVVISISMAAAVIIADSIGFEIPIMLFFLIICAVGIRSLISRKLDIVMLITALFTAAALISYAYSTGEHIHRSVSLINRYVTYNGVIMTPGKESSYDDNYKYIVRVKELSNKTYGTVKTNENILVTAPVKLRCGDSITGTGIIKDLPSQMNENGFDMKKYYKSQNVYTKVFSDDAKNAGNLRVFSPSIIAGCLREAVDSIIYKYYYGDTAAVLSAVLTGSTHSFSEKYERALSRTTFKRLFHPAYLHLSLLLSFIALFASVTPKKPRDAATILLIIIYALFNCTQMSFLRCFATAALLIFFRMKNGAAHFPDVISWIVIVFVLAAPTVLLNAGFVISVLSSIIIWMFSPHIRILLDVLPKRLRRTASVMLICAVFCTPVTAIYFNGISPYSFLMPFITMPLVIIILVASPLTFIMLKLFSAAPAVKGFLDASLWVLLKLPIVVERLPLSYFSIPAPRPSEILTTVFLILAAYCYLRNSGRRAAHYGLLAAAFAASSVIFPLSQIGTTEFTFVNVGQGDGSVIHTTFGATVIIDGGGGSAYSDYDPGEALFVPYLDAKGFDTIDAAFVSHLHQDHVQGVIDTIRDKKVKQVFVPDVPPNAPEDIKEWAQKLEEICAECGTNLNYVNSQTRISFGKGLTLDLYPPDEVVKVSREGNDSSMLIKASYKGTSVLYTGDITAFGEHELLCTKTDVDSDILKVGHHGSRTSTTPEWVDAVSPEYAVISCGENNSYGHPAPETLKALSTVTVLRTDLNGDIRIKVGKNGITNLRLLKQENYNGKSSKEE